MTISFKRKVRDKLLLCADIYQNNFVNDEYLIYSPNLVKREYYIIAAKEDNYLHLTGVSTKLSAKQFFYKCLEDTLLEKR